MKELLKTISKKFYSQDVSAIMVEACLFIIIVGFVFEAVARLFVPGQG